MVIVATHREKRLRVPSPSRSPTCMVVAGGGGGGGGGGAPPTGPVDRSMPKEPPRPKNGSPSNGDTRMVYVPAAVGIACSVSWRPIPHSPPAAHVLEARTVTSGS